MADTPLFEGKEHFFLFSIAFPWNTWPLVASSGIALSWTLSLSLNSFRLAIIKFTSTKRQYWVNCPLLHVSIASTYLQGRINTALYITGSFEDTEPARLQCDNNCAAAAVAAPHQTVCPASSPGVFLRFSAEHSAVHGVTSLCEYQRLCTEVALRHRDVNYKGVTETLKDVREYVYCAETKDMFGPQSHQHKYNRNWVVTSQWQKRVPSSCCIVHFN